MLDTMIEAYKGLFSSLTHTVREMEITGEVPDGHLEGAPKTVDEATTLMLGMLVLVDRILFDLNALRMDMLFSETFEKDN